MDATLEETMYQSLFSCVPKNIDKNLKLKIPVLK